MPECYWRKDAVPRSFLFTSIANCPNIKQGSLLDNAFNEAHMRLLVPCPTHMRVFQWMLI